jgi:tetratricopeptide (TPR) repeat protein
MATTHALYAAALLALGRPDLAERERALQLEPPSPLFTVGVGWSHFYSRDYHLADKFYEEALKKDAGFPAAYWSLGESLEAQRKLPEAIAAFEKAAIMTNRDPRALAGLGHAEGLAGRKREALTIAEELQQRARGMYVPAYFLSLVYLGAGDIDSAMSWLERSADQREDWLVFIHAHPMFDAVRQNPRYRAVEQRVGLWK